MEKFLFQINVVFDFVQCQHISYVLLVLLEIMLERSCFIQV